MLQLGHIYDVLIINGVLKGFFKGCRVLFLLLFNQCDFVQKKMKKIL